jgi:hypothetical protein
MQLVNILFNSIVQKLSLVTDSYATGENIPPDVTEPEAGTGLLLICGW